MKRRTLSISAIVTALAGLMAVLAACEVSPTATPTTAPTATPTPQQSTSDPTLVQNPDGTSAINTIPLTTDRRMTILGAGATFPFVLHSQFSESYSQLNPGIQINYTSVGSGAGIRQVIEKTVDYGGADGPMTDDQKASAGADPPHPVVPLPGGRAAVACGPALRPAGPAGDRHGEGAAHDRHLRPTRLGDHAAVGTTGGRSRGAGWARPCSPRPLHGESGRGVRLAPPLSFPYHPTSPSSPKEPPCPTPPPCRPQSDAWRSCAR